MCPIPAVIAIASASQNMTRAMPRHMFAPPAQAPSAGAERTENSQQYQ